METGLFIVWDILVNGNWGLLLECHCSIMCLFDLDVLGLEALTEAVPVAERVQWQPSTWFILRLAAHLEKRMQGAPMIPRSFSPRFKEHLNHFSGVDNSPHDR